MIYSGMHCSYEALAIHVTKSLRRFGARRGLKRIDVGRLPTSVSLRGRFAANLPYNIDVQT
ncbi:MAG TPA: hypothetical protein VFR47_25520 [Anaerolineales bacterium]|nr:hypothetical protein [Anaerolineales bacterium]